MKKKKVIPILIMLLLCSKANYVVLGAKGYHSHIHSHIYSHNSGTSGDISLMSLLIIFEIVEVLYCIKYFIFYKKGLKKLSSSIKRLIVVIILGLVIFIYSDNQRVVNNNSELYTVRTQWDTPLRSTLKSFKVSDKTIPQGIYQVNTSNYPNEIHIIIATDNDRGKTELEKKVFETDSPKLINRMERRNYFNSQNSSTIFLPEGARVAVSSDDFKDYNDKVTFKKVDNINKITQLSAEENGLYKIPDNQKKLKVDIVETNQIPRYKGPLTDIFTFNEEQLIEYHIYNDAYVEDTYKISDNKLSLESSKEHYYKNEEIEDGQISVGLLGTTFSYSLNYPGIKNIRIHSKMSLNQ